ncbi:hypothetical protein VPBG_00072 [Vibrio phage helene 12B3]|uniref:hypothetical protein n=1 Tax=Vibrio phage helene 12B3 TaxID=573173 RepID=UPI0002C07147|nr:hypothetical protein VPBG_00072 [Vibrio phage helene 12B3]AGG57844.1 hypothetical protein VPBG_00072 [Vibrio phage helene 12B3]
MAKIEPLSTEQLMKFLVDISVQLDRKLGLDSGDRDMLSYAFVGHSDWELLQEDGEAEIIFDNGVFSVMSSPNFDYNAVLNKSYKSS